MCQGDARLPLEEHQIIMKGTREEKGKREFPNSAGPSHRKWRPLPEGAGLALRANGMPGFVRAKMKDRPFAPGLTLPARKPMRVVGRIVSGSSVSPILKLASLNK